MAFVLEYGTSGAVARNFKVFMREQAAIGDMNTKTAYETERATYQQVGMTQKGVKPTYKPSKFVEGSLEGKKAVGGTGTFSCQLLHLSVENIIALQNISGTNVDILLESTVGDFYYLIPDILYNFEEEYPGGEAQTLQINVEKETPTVTQFRTLAAIPTT